MSKESISRIEKFVQLGSDITGNLAGSALGFLMAGPPGAFAGAAAGPAIKHVLSGLAEDVLARTISQREKTRMSATLIFAADKVRKRLEEGKKPREDGFFASDGLHRAPAEEIAEGVVLAAQRDHEEKKLRFYGNLLANLAFVPGIDQGHANLLLRLGQDLSYRQLCLIVLFRAQDQNLLRKTDYRKDPASVKGTTIPILQEIYDLFRRGMITSGGSYLLGLADIKPSVITPEGTGVTLYNLMELHEIDFDDVNALIPQLQ